MYNNDTGSYNVALGSSALYLSTQDSNTAVGATALGNTSSGIGNTAVGAAALLANYEGSYNTALGDSANVSNHSWTNATAIGNRAIASYSNTVQIGNAAVTDVYFGTPAITVLHAASVTPSDARFKYNIKNDVHGLDFIMQLKPVSFNFNTAKMNYFIKTGILDTSNIYKASFTDDSHKHSGFLAQDVEQAAKNIGYDFDGVLAPNGTTEKYYSLSYSQFVVPLVKSVQELSAQNDTLKATIAAQQQQLNDLKSTSTQQQQQLNDLKATVAQLQAAIKKP